MGAQKGKDLLLKVGDGAGGYTTVAGLRTRSLTLGAATIDVTDADSDGQWRELLSGGGVRHASVAGTGVFKDAASDTLAQTLFFSGETRAWQVVVPDFGTLSGAFQITSLEYSGDYQGEMTFNLALESAGAVDFGGGVMANRHRGEIAAELGGRVYSLCLTLGALAELEAAFGAADLMALAQRFEAGRFSAADAVKIIAAGLRGAGHDLSDDEVGRLPTPGGAAGYVKILAALLAATFGGPDATAEVPEAGPDPRMGAA